jgi:hypothetical protein
VRPSPKHKAQPFRASPSRLPPARKTDKEKNGFFSIPEKAFGFSDSVGWSRAVLFAEIAAHSGYVRRDSSIAVAASNLRGFDGTK